MCRSVWYHFVNLFLTPEVRVIHTGLVVGHSNEGCVRGPLVHQVQQNLMVVHRQVVHVLWRLGGRKLVWIFFWLYSRCESNIQILYFCGETWFSLDTKGIIAPLVCAVYILQLTGPEVGIGAHHPHNQWAGHPPCQRRAMWKRPSDLQGHHSAPQTLHPLTH